QIPPAGTLLFDCRHFLRWCCRLSRPSPAPPARRSRPAPDQFAWNVVMAVMRGPRAVAREDPGPVIHGAIRVLRLREFPLPLAFEHGALIRGDHAGHPPQGGALQIVARVFEIGVKGPPAHWSMPRPGL